jgi:ferredoxin
MKVRVDRTRCETNALCVGMAPDLFELNGDYPVQVPDAIRQERHAEVREIVASCPTAALSVDHAGEE